MKFIRLAIALLTLVTLATAQDTLTGKWKITWLQGGNPNIVFLTETTGDSTGNIVTGDYTNDTKQLCPVVGTVNNANVVLIVNCPRWDIKLIGEFSHAMGEPSDNEIDGRYLAFDTTQGTFRMDRQICMLPEGCTGETK